MFLQILEYFRIVMEYLKDSVRTAGTTWLLADFFHHLRAFDGLSVPPFHTSITFHYNWKNLDHQNLLDFESVCQA